MEEPIVLDKYYTLKLDDILDKDWENRHNACNFRWESSDRDVEFYFVDGELNFKWTRGEDTFSITLTATNCYNQEQIINIEGKFESCDIEYAVYDANNWDKNHTKPEYLLGSKYIEMYYDS